MSLRSTSESPSPSFGALAPSPIFRRWGTTPAERGSATNCTCPDVFELQDGNFAIIGTDRTEELRDGLPADAGVASYERIVVIPRDTFLAAAKELA
ncbi:hypothetical protein [Mangrovihabitans endophyticus]|uniref:Uncharacterized protein n=1 Tax=Mangrovihabitans endophyticus TaxID=1751298 RepID=A0A8J3C3G8_9ACTN|nr:hypothetical protein [Mangrovihabitans endophyticus]GGL13247.1 hypothetical protein GCM10012284_54920 [Mangrovihabitans endophyticus]